MPVRRPYRQIIDGIPRCPWINPEVFRKNQSFRVADGDVVQYTYPKSGTHWVQCITQLIIKSGEAVDGYGEFTRNTRAFEYTDCFGWKSDLPMRLFYTHLPLHRATMNDKAKYVYVARNPWDVCISMFHMITDVSIYRFQDGTFEEFFETFLEGDLGYGDYFEHVAAGYALKDEPNMFFVTYEELMKDTTDTVLKLAYFLGESYGRALEDDDQVLQNVLHYSQAEHMRKIIVVETQKNDSQGWDDVFARNKVTSKRGYEGDKYRYSVVREAKVGSWKDYFTPAMLVRFEEKIQEVGDKASFMMLWGDIREEAITAQRACAQP